MTPPTGRRNFRSSCRGTANAPDPPNHTVDINFYGKLYVGLKQMTGTCP